MRLSPLTISYRYVGKPRNHAGEPLRDGFVFKLPSDEVRNNLFGRNIYSYNPRTNQDEQVGTVGPNWKRI